MVVHLVLVQAVGVRIPAPQQKKEINIEEQHFKDFQRSQQP